MPPLEALSVLDHCLATRWPAYRCCIATVLRGDDIAREVNRHTVHRLLSTSKYTPTPALAKPRRTGRGHMPGFEVGIKVSPPSPVPRLRYTRWSGHRVAATIGADDGHGLDVGTTFQQQGYHLGPVLSSCKHERRPAMLRTGGHGLRLRSIQTASNASGAGASHPSRNLQPRSGGALMALADCVLGINIGSSVQQQTGNPGKPLPGRPTERCPKALRTTTRSRSAHR